MSEWCPENDGAYRDELAAVRENFSAVCHKRDHWKRRAEAAEAALERVREIIGREWDFRDARLLADELSAALKEGE